jgi:hypothetical protein
MIIFTPYYIYAQNLSSLFYLTNYTVPVLRLASCDLRLKFFRKKIRFFLSLQKKAVPLHRFSERKVAGVVDRAALEMR